MNWKRIIVDSRHRTADSVSSSDFFVDLPPTHVPAGSQLFIDGVCISIAWPVIGPGRDKLPLRPAANTRKGTGAKCEKRD